MGSSIHLIPLKPELFTDFECVQCGKKDFSSHGFVFPGIHIQGKYTCNGCGLEFYRDLPVGFAVNHPMTITKDYKLYGSSKNREWISEPLLDGIQNKNEQEVQVERLVYKKVKQVIILNTLDFLYGHVLLKLYNAIYYLEKYPEKS